MTEIIGVTVFFILLGKLLYYIYLEIYGYTYTQDIEIRGDFLKITLYIWHRGRIVYSDVQYAKKDNADEFKKLKKHMHELAGEEIKLLKVYNKK